MSISIIAPTLIQFIVGQNEHYMKILNEMDTEMHFDRSKKDDWESFIENMPNQNESAKDFVAAHPEKFFIPFEDEFKCLQQTLIQGSGRVRQQMNVTDILRAPSVIVGDSVQRKDNRHPQPARIDAVTGADATVKWRYLNELLLLCCIINSHVLYFLETILELTMRWKAQSLNLRLNDPVLSRQPCL
jgi:hypothetical protein